MDSTPTLSENLTRAAVIAYRKNLRNATKAQIQSLNEKPVRITDALLKQNSIPTNKDIDRLSRQFGLLTYRKLRSQFIPTFTKADNPPEESEEIRRKRNRLRGLKGALTRHSNALRRALDGGDEQTAFDLMPKIAATEAAIDALENELPDAGPKLGRPIRPRRLDADLYNRTLQQLVIDPVNRQLRSGIAEAKGAAEAFDVLQQRPSMPVEDKRLESEILPHFNRINGWHRKEIISVFRQAVAISVDPLLKDGPIRTALHNRVRENVGLIKTIPKRLHDSVYEKLTEALKTEPFNRQLLENILQTEFKKSAGRARLIARDQTNKAVGQFTQLRHEQIGIHRYEWSSSGDQRVRPTHRANDGKIFSYDNPPATTGNPGWDIACRCVGLPVFEDLEEEQIEEANQEEAYRSMSPVQQTRALESETIGLSLWQQLQNRRGGNDPFVQRHISETERRIAILRTVLRLVAANL